jgi:hypothetical protein
MNFDTMIHSNRAVLAKLRCIMDVWQWSALQMIETNDCRQEQRIDPSIRELHQFFALFCYLGEK